MATSEKGTSGNREDERGKKAQALWPGKHGKFGLPEGD